MLNALKIAAALMEMDDFISKDDVLEMGQPPKIKWYKTERSPCTEEDDCPDDVLVDEGEDLMTPDEIDRLEETITSVDIAQVYLERMGVHETSSSDFHPGLWYISRSSPNMRTGVETETTYHLYGFTEDEEEQIYQRLNL